jgi:uncharacterized protein YjiS (DUF1127 family)
VKGRGRSTSYGARMSKTVGSDGSQLSDAVKRAFVTLQIWRERVRQRRELAQWTDHDLHDVGLSWSDIALEIKKSFWRA